MEVKIQNTIMIVVKNNNYGFIFKISFSNKNEISQEFIYLFLFQLVIGWGKLQGLKIKKTRRPNWASCCGL
jgi:hypothetical protein